MVGPPDHRHSYGHHLVERVVDQAMPQSHVAKAMGVSRQCVPKWVKRYKAEGEDWSARPVLAAAPSPVADL